MIVCVVSLCVFCSIMLLGPSHRARTRTSVAELLVAGQRALGSRRTQGPSVHEDAATALRQLSALLQSGRTQSHAWSDLRDHWQARGGADHPLTILASCVAASEAMGRGAVEGLRRGREAILEAQDPSAAVSGTGASSRWGEDGSGGAAVARPAGPEVIQGLRGLLRGAEAKELALVMRVVDRLTAISALSERTGAPLARLLDQAASSFEDDAQVQSAVKAAVAGPRLTQLLLTALPLGGLLLGQLMGSGGIMFFVTSIWGPLCLVVGLALLALGYLWSARMIRRVRHEW